MHNTYKSQYKGLLLNTLLAPDTYHIVYVCHNDGT